MDTISTLFQEAIEEKYKHQEAIQEEPECHSVQSSIKWEISVSDYKIELQVFKNDLNLICKKTENHDYPLPIYKIASLLFNNNDIVILTTFGILIYHFNENNKSIYFKEDLTNNRVFLSIITSTMPLLNEYYPEYISKYSLETTMIIDSSFYSIEHQNKKLHLHSFFSLQIVNLSKSLLWTKYSYLM